MDAPFEQPGSYHDADTTNPQDYTHMILYLLNVGQSLCGQTRGVLERLCQEVALATQQRARLLLRYQRFPDVADSSSSTMEVNFPVQFRDRTYGTVSIAADGTDPTRPALPLPVGHVLAQVCRGYDQKAIAKELGVTVATVSKHQQNIYEQLGVHNTHDALQVAFQAGLFSPLEEFLDSW